MGSDRGIATFSSLDETLTCPYSTAHDQRRDHYRCPSPPHLSGQGGRLRLDYRLRRWITVPRRFPQSSRDMVRRLLD
jgi:hypothetical protein